MLKIVIQNVVKLNCLHNPKIKMDFKNFQKLFNDNKQKSEWISNCETDLLNLITNLKDNKPIPMNGKTIILPTILWCSDQDKLDQVCAELQTKFKGFNFYSEILELGSGAGAYIKFDMP
jgi:hypothetical protein